LASFWDESRLPTNSRLKEINLNEINRRDFRTTIDSVFKGEVYHLTKVPDFAGKYVAAEGEFALAKGRRKSP